MIISKKPSRSRPSKNSYFYHKTSKRPENKKRLMECLYNTSIQNMYSHHTPIINHTSPKNERENLVLPRNTKRMKRRYYLYSLVLRHAAILVWTGKQQGKAMAFVPVALLHKRTRPEPPSPLWLSAAVEPETKRDEPPMISFRVESEDLPPLHESEYTQVLSTMSISPIATVLRDAYDDHFEDPRQPNGDRFAWDPWFVTAADGRRPNHESKDEAECSESTGNSIDGEEQALAGQIQYSLKRIQTSLFFPEEEYNSLVDDLVSLANSIGLTAISPPWTSMYTDGDTQNFHTDVSFLFCPLECNAI